MTATLAPKLAPEWKDRLGLTQCRSPELYESGEAISDVPQQSHQLRRGERPLRVLIGVPAAIIQARGLIRPGVGIGMSTAYPPAHSPIGAENSRFTAAGETRAPATR